MQKQLVESSNIKSIGYNKENQTLEVEFKNGTTYRYYDVPESIYDEMIIAESFGKHFMKYIRGKFITKKL